MGLTHCSLDALEVEMSTSRIAGMGLIYLTAFIGLSCSEAPHLQQQSFAVEERNDRPVPSAHSTQAEPPVGEPEPPPRIIPATDVNTLKALTDALSGAETEPAVVHIRILADGREYVFDGSPLLQFKAHQVASVGALYPVAQSNCRCWPIDDVSYMFLANEVRDFERLVWRRTRGWAQKPQLQDIELCVRANTYESWVALVKETAARRGQRPIGPWRLSVSSTGDRFVQQLELPSTARRE